MDTNDKEVAQFVRLDSILRKQEKAKWNRMRNLLQESNVTNVEQIERAHYVANAITRLGDPISNEKFNIITIEWTYLGLASASELDEASRRRQERLHSRVRRRGWLRSLKIEIRKNINENKIGK